jgi:hypothetical protein
MNPFKKLQENSLYWRYRFITRRWLAAKRWTRSLRRPQMRQVRHRGNVVWVPGSYGSTWRGRGFLFVVVTAAALTVVQTVLGTRLTGLSLSILEVAIVAALVYAFTRSPT